MLTALAIAALVCAALPAAQAAANLRRFRLPPPTRDRPACSVVVPARDEATQIGACLAAILAASRADDEIIVVDDGSTDATAAIVVGIAARDARVRLVAAAPPPDGWCGKMHACWSGAAEARGAWLCFIDADVRLGPDALDRLAAAMRPPMALVSAPPRQITGSWSERAVVPLMQVLLLGFLPMRRMRASDHPAYAAGCGQLVACDAAAYHAIGGHAAIAGSIHDGIDLPRAFRRAGLRTDVVDGSAIAACRMFAGLRPLWRGLTRNATAGLGAPARIVPATLLLGLGQVVPLPLAIAAVAAHAPLAACAAVLAAVASLALRAAVDRRVGAHGLGTLLHPLGVALLLAMQWWALAAALAGRRAEWRGRRYRRLSASSGAVAPGAG